MANRVQTIRMENLKPDQKIAGGTGESMEAGAPKAEARRGSDYLKDNLMEMVVEEENLNKAYKTVVKNKGTAGIDNMTVQELLPYLREHGQRIREELLEGKYKPEAVLRVEIEKSEGKGIRELGIPTVVDRFIQQALLQVITPIFDCDFSELSYGFRKGRSTHQAIKKASEYVAEGYSWVVDIGIEKFFDRVNHDILMSRIARKVQDKRVLKLIRKYLQAGVMIGGLVSPREEGTPQGGPISPLLSNILLDELDKELEKRGHKFCRYADDCNIYVRSQRAGERVKASITQFLLKKLRLKVNEEKSAVDRPWKRTFLSYSFTRHQGKPRLTVSQKALKRFRLKLKEIFRRGKGRNVEKLILEELTPLMRGWLNYFRLAEMESTFKSLDGWIRRRLRCIYWRQWKSIRTRMKRLIRLGLTVAQAKRATHSGRGPWWSAGYKYVNFALDNKFFEDRGFKSLLMYPLQKAG